MKNFSSKFTFLSAYTNKHGIPSAIYKVTPEQAEDLLKVGQSTQVRDNGDLTVILPRHEDAFVEGDKCKFELEFEKAFTSSGEPMTHQNADHPLFGQQLVYASIVGQNQIEVDNDFKVIALAARAAKIMKKTGVSMELAMKLIGVVDTQTRERIDSKIAARDPQVGDSKRGRSKVVLFGSAGAGNATAEAEAKAAKKAAKKAEKAAKKLAGENMNAVTT